MVCGQNRHSSFPMKPRNTDSLFDFGRSLAIYEDTVLIGSLCEWMSGGCVYIYNRSGSVWIQEDLISDYSVKTFGNSVSLFEDTALFGCVDLRFLFLPRMMMFGQNKLSLVQIIRMRMTNLVKVSRCIEARPL